MRLFGKTEPKVHKVPDRGTDSPTVDLANMNSNYNCVYSLIVNDGTVDSVADTVTINVTADNDEPGFVDLANTVTIDEEDNLVLIVTGSDVDDSAVSLSATNTPTTATFTDNGNNSGTLDWTPDLTESGTYTVDFELDDGTNTVTETVTITVNDAGDPEGDDEEEITIDDVGSIKGKKKGPGTIKVYDNDDNILCQVQAWPTGGSIPRLVKLQKKWYFSVVKNRYGTTTHIYKPIDAEGGQCELIEKKKLSPKLHPRKMATKNFIGNKKTQEIAISTKRNGHIYVKIFKYNVTQDRWKLLRLKVFADVPDNYSIKATKKKNLLVKDNKGNVLYKWIVK